MKKHVSFTSQPERPTLGFLTPGLQVDSRLYQVWVGSVEAAGERDVNLITFSVGRLYNEVSRLENKRKALQNLISTERLDGLITFEWWDAEQFKQVCARYRPLPIVNVMQQVDGYHCVLLNFHDLMPVKMRHLIEDHGYRRIAYVHGNDTSFILRLQGEAYGEILHSYGLPLEPDLVVPYPLPSLPERDSDAYFMRGKEAVRVLLDERRLRPGRDIEAIMGWSDALGWGMLEALHERGVRVPHDIAVIGSGGEEASQFSIPPLTTTAPPYHRMGRKAVEMMLSVIAGEPVEEQTVLPVGLHLRRSCGCLDSSIIRAKADTTRNRRESFEVMVSSRRITVMTAMEQATDGRWSCAGDWAEQLLTAFVAELNPSSRPRTEKGEFIPTLESILYRVDSSGSDVNLGQDALSALHAQLFPCLSDDGELLGEAESLWQQGRVLIHHIARQADMRKQAQKDQQATTLRAIGQQLINTFDVQGVIDVLAEGLPRLEIPGCYLCLYDNPAAPAEGARLRLAYNAQGRIEVGAEGQPFPSLQVVPDGLLPTENCLSLIVESLHFNDEPIGFVVFETAPQHERTIYDILRGEMSSALQGALLLGKMTRQKYILDAFMENVPDSIYFKDCDSRITHTNPAFARHVGLSDPAELIGKNDFDFFPEEHARTTYEQEQKILRTGTPVFALEEADVHGNWELTTKMPLRDEHGKIIGTFGISRDITELKRTQRHLEATIKELQDFAYVVSHDLKEPLRGVAQLSSWIVNDYTAQLDEKGHKMLGLLEQQVGRMNALINGILNYSRAGCVRGADHEIELRPLIDAIIKSLALPEHIQIRVAGTLPTLWADEVRIVQVFQNLIGNAVKFMDKPRGRIRIWSDNHEAFWRIYVADNGPGIAPCHHDRIFGIFQTLGTHSERESTGVGLAIVKKIIEFYGGRITLESTEGDGCTFIITFPKTFLTAPKEEVSL